MDLKELDRYFRSILPIDEFSGVDNSLNGLQVENRTGTVSRVAFAVDASLEAFKGAADKKADMLFVHHGILWGKESPLTGSRFRRAAFMIENNIALYAVHLPLDRDEKLGNNISAAKKCGLESIEEFGEYKGKKIGFKGVFKEPVTCSRVIDRLGFSRQNILSVLEFGPEKIRTAGIITGGAGKEVEQAVAEGLDLFITGEISHSLYHYCLEEGVSIISAGHYQTETFGVKNVMAALKKDLGLDTVYLDIPTGL